MHSLLGVLGQKERSGSGAVYRPVPRKAAENTADGQVVERAGLAAPSNAGQNVSSIRQHPFMRIPVDGRRGRLKEPCNAPVAWPVVILSRGGCFSGCSAKDPDTLEGGERVAPQIAALTAAGIPVMAHIGFTPQSVNGLGGFRVQGRGDGADQLIADAIAVQEAGAFSVVMEMVPADLAGQITRKLTIPTVGIGAGNETDAQVLVWQDMAGLTHGKTAKFVKRFADVGSELRSAAEQYADEVRRGVFPGPEHSY